MFEVVMMIGFDRNPVAPGTCSCALGSGEVATVGPFGVLRPDLRIAGVEREAALASAFARSGSCIRVVSSDRREVRFGRESTRWNSSRSFTEEDLLWSSESSQSDESSSSSIALSDTSSSSSSDSSKTGLCSAARPTMTSSLNEVCFRLQLLLTWLPPRLRLSDRQLLRIWLSKELSSSPDEVPMVNIGAFFFGFACVA